MSRFFLVHPLGRLITAGSLLLAIFACVPKGKSVPDGGFDLKAEDLGPLLPVGTGCTEDKECGRDKVCSMQILQGGYCTATCNSDDNCMPDGVCVKLLDTTTGAEKGNFCLEKCTEKGNCQRLQTTVECWDRMRFDTGVCYDTSPGGKTQRCNPSSLALCALPGAGGTGGCVRRGLGGGTTLGLCEPPCVIGNGTCTVDPLTGGPRQCIVVNPTVTRDGMLSPNTSDKFLGTACMPVPTVPARKAVGAGCVVDGETPIKYYTDVCVDGAQCKPEEINVANRLCQQLCYNPALSTKPTPTIGTVAPDCPGGTSCQDVWGLFSNSEPMYQVGLCR